MSRTESTVGILAKPVAVLPSHCIALHTHRDGLRSRRKTTIAIDFKLRAVCERFLRLDDIDFPWKCQIVYPNGRMVGKVVSGIIEANESKNLCRDTEHKHTHTA